MTDEVEGPADLTRYGLPRPTDRVDPGTLVERAGPIRLEPVSVDVGRPYYRAVTSIDALALIETPPEGPSEGGSNSLHRWTRTQRIRTAARLDIRAALVETAPPPVYQEVAPKAKHLRELGMSDKAIARALGVSDKTAAKAADWCDSFVADRL